MTHNSVIRSYRRKRCVGCKISVMKMSGSNDWTIPLLLIPILFHSSLPRSHSHLVCHGFETPTSFNIPGGIIHRQTLGRRTHGEWSRSSNNSPIRHFQEFLATSNNELPRESSDEALRVGIVGAGAVSYGTASLVSSLGCHDEPPMIWSPSGSGTKDLIESAVKDDDDDNGHASIQSLIHSTGAIAQTFPVRIARSARQLVEQNDVLVLALPVNGHRRVMEDIAPWILRRITSEISSEGDGKVGGNVGPRMHVVISSHASLGAVYLMQLLRQERHRYLDDNYEYSDEEIGVRITAWGTTAVTARKTSGTSVNVLTVRKVVDFCTVPSLGPRSNDENKVIPTKTVPTKAELLSDGYRLCTTLFGPRFRLRHGGLLAVSLSNLNPQNHLGIVLGNMSRMDPPPLPPPLPESYRPSSSADISMTVSKYQKETKAEPWYQGLNITPNVGRLMEALDKERITIAKELDIDVRTIYQHFSWSFHVPMEIPYEQNDNHNGGQNDHSNNKHDNEQKMRPLTISEMNQQMHHYLQNDVLGPSTPDSRYVLEDVPYGLVLTVILGRLVNRPAVLHEAGIRIVSAMYGRDFMTQNELLDGLGIFIDEENVKNKDDPMWSLERWREMAYSGYFNKEA